MYVTQYDYKIIFAAICVIPFNMIMLRKTLTSNGTFTLPTQILKKNGSRIQRESAWMPVPVQYYHHIDLCKPLLVGLGLSVGQCEHTININKCAMY